MSRALLLLAFLTGCRAEPYTEKDGTDSTAPDDGINHCAGAQPGTVPGFEDFAFLEVAWTSGETDALNWAWKTETPRTVTVNIDSESFAGETVTPAQVRTTLQNAMDFWNDTANIDLVVGEDELVCCQRSPSSCDRTCEWGDDHVDIFLATAADEDGIPAGTRSTYGDDPNTEVEEESCLTASDVWFYPNGIGKEGDPVSYNWVNLDDNVSDTNDTDGSVDKPFHNTLVHELGHVLGLGDQSAASVGCSVMSHCTARNTDTTDSTPDCYCNFDTIESLDETVLTHVYGL